MILDIVAIIISGIVLLSAIVGVGWRIGFLLGRLTQEVRGHNKRLDEHAEILENVRMECKSLQGYRMTSRESQF